jgi:hypothetical protein
MWLMSMPLTYVIALGVGALVRGIAWLLGAGRRRSASPAASLDRFYIDALPACWAVFFALLFQVFVASSGDRKLPPDMTAQAIAFVIVLVLAWLWTFIGILGLRVVYGGVSNLMSAGRSKG